MILEVWMKSKLAMSTAIVGTSLMLPVSPVQAHWHGHNGSAWGAGIAGFAAGAILGSALAPRPYYYYGGPICRAIRATPQSLTASGTTAPTTRPPAPISGMTGIGTPVRNSGKARSSNFVEARVCAQTMPNFMA